MAIVTKKLLTRSDEITAKLLGHVSCHVRPDVCKQFATGPLGLEENEYDLIEADFPTTAKRRHMQVLIDWHKRDFMVTTQSFITQLVQWQKSGFINRTVWGEMGRFVEPELLPGPDITRAPPTDRTTAAAAPSGGKHGELDQTDYDDLLESLKQSLIDRCKNYMSNDWLPEDDAKTFAMKGYYIEPCWTRTVKKGLQDEQVPMNRLYDVFEIYQNTQSSQQSIKILVEGEAGSGKSSAMAKLVLDWAGEKSIDPESCEEPIDRKSKFDTKLEKFDFTFLVQLKDVDSDIPLEKIIVQQHDLNTEESQINFVLQRSKTLVIFDGYDEYSKGTNSDIDAAISGKTSIINKFYIVTSRPGDYMDKKDRNKLDGEVQIRGLSRENIQTCCARYLESEEKSQDLISKSQKTGIYDLMRIPIILLMLCVLYLEIESLPETKTDIVWEIVQMYIGRAEAKGNEFVDLDHVLYILGELSWLASQRDTQQLLIRKSDVEKVSKDILKLGLLHGTMLPQKARLSKQLKWLTYAHKMLQDFMAGYYASKQDKVKLQEMFPCWDNITRQIEVMKFAVGKGTSGTVDHVCKKFADMVIDGLRSNTSSYDCAEYKMQVLAEILEETKEKPADILCNIHINYVTELPLRTASRLYVFGERYNWLPHVTDGGRNHDDWKAPETCALVINKPHIPGHEVLNAISNLNQTITDLRISNFEIGNGDLCVFKKPLFKMNQDARSVYLGHWNIPSDIQKDLGRQLASCHKLQVLRIFELPYIAQELFSRLADKINLTHLALSGCDLLEEQCQVICQQLQSLHRLEEIDLRENHIGSTGAKYLAESIRSWCQNNPLKKLWMNDCKIDASGCIPLMEALALCKQLQQLFISMNPIIRTFQHVDTHLVYPKLEGLYMNDTSLSGEDIQGLAAMINNHQMPRLQHLFLGYNMTSGGERKDLGDSPFLSTVLFHWALSDEVDETLEALRIIVQKVPDVHLLEGRFRIWPVGIEDIVRDEQRNRAIIATEMYSNALNSVQF